MSYVIKPKGKKCHQLKKNFATRYRQVEVPQSEKKP